MKLLDLIERSQTPEPWGEADNIPWNEPAFSARMLAEHLSQNHDAASRRAEIIEKQVHWIHRRLLNERPAQILDLACGPGLYAGRLARLGHSVIGIDFSPASIRHARQEAEKAGLNCTYIESDIRRREYGGLYDFIMLLYGEFNVFKRADAALILEKANQALKPGGLLLLEPQDYAAVQRAGRQPPVWRTHHRGLFSDRPHLYLQENFWDEGTGTLTTRYWVVDAETADVSRNGQTTQAYSDAGLEQLLGQHGFGRLTFYPALAPQENQSRQHHFGLTAVKLSG